MISDDDDNHHHQYHRRKTSEFAYLLSVCFSIHSTVSINFYLQLAIFLGLISNRFVRLTTNATLSIKFILI